MLREAMGLQGFALGRDFMFDVSRNARMLVIPGRAYHKTTHSHHRFRRHPNLLRVGPQQVLATHSEQVWISPTWSPQAGSFT